MENKIKQMIDSIIDYAHTIDIEITRDRIELQFCYNEGFDILFFVGGNNRPIHLADYTAMYISYRHIDNFVSLYYEDIESALQEWQSKVVE